MFRLTHVCILVCILNFSVNAQDSISVTENYRPKIGLVLSGGGAKGMAHIGVLKVLEELGIRPDYITGTSMGSIMGGLYASGYKANELDSIIKLINWNNLLSDNIPLSKVVPEEKNDYKRFLFQFDITKKGPVLPTGVVVGQGITEEMNYLTWHMTGIDHFDDFPIPFRCVAADLISGEAYTFDSGSLPIAMRASMAIPSVFSPVLLDSMLLVDGGVLDNMPVQACINMGAEIIIAVNVGLKGRPKAEDYKSITDVLMGAAMIRSNYIAQEAKEKVDILIEPDLDGYSAGSFSNGEQIIELGEIAAREHYVELASLAEFLNQYPQKKEPHVSTNWKELYIEDIKVEGLKRLNKQFVLGKFGLEKKHTYTTKDINEGMHLLMGTRYIQNVDYRLETGEHGYILTLLPTEAFPSKYNFSIHYDNEYNASAIFNVALRNYLIRGSSFKLTFELSEYPQLNTEYIDYLGSRQKTGDYIKGHWEKSSVPYVDDQGEEVGSFNEQLLLLEGGFLFVPNIKRIIRVGAFFRRQVSKSGSGIIDLMVNDVNKIGNSSWGFNLKYNKNSLDKQFFPTKGSLLNIDLEYPVNFSTIYDGSDSARAVLNDIIEIPNQNYFKAAVVFNQYIPVSKNFNISYLLSAGGASEDMGSLQYFQFGGIQATRRYNDIPFVGLTTKEISAQQYAMGNVSLRYEAMNNFFIGLTGSVLDYETKYDNLSFDSLNVFGSDKVVYGGGILFSYQSILGPIQLGYGRTSMHSKNRYYFSVGFPF